MDAHELRIGNTVMYNNKIHTVGIYDIDNHIDFKPIKLNEEWLKRCAFKFKELGFNDLSVSYGIIKGEIHFCIGNYYVKLEYVHQLQNLYFALTGEELTIKE